MPPQGILQPQNRRGTDETTMQHDGGHEANGLVGLLIASIIWNGLEIDSDFNIWQHREEPIDVFETPYQSLQPQLIQMAARARTIAEWNTANVKVRGLREIDKEATAIHSKMSAEEKGVLRTTLMGGAMAKQDIAKINEDVDDNCNFCKQATSTPVHITWVCPFFKDIRLELDPELANVPIKYLYYCVQCGIAPAMKTNGEQTYWGGSSMLMLMRRPKSCWERILLLT
jgi:hypothetical protein